MRHIGMAKVGEVVILYANVSALLIYFFTSYSLLGVAIGVSRSLASNWPHQGLKNARQLGK